MSESLMIANLVIGSVHFIVTSMLHMRMKLECCGHPCLETDPIETSDKKDDDISPPTQLASPTKIQ